VLHKKAAHARGERPEIARRQQDHCVCVCVCEHTRVLHILRGRSHAIARRQQDHSMCVCVCARARELHILRGRSHARRAARKKNSPSAARSLPPLVAF
jgi:hypothetical protein